MNEHLKQVAVVAADFGAYAEQVFADGKLTAMEGFGFLPKLMAIPGLLENKEAIASEWKNRTTETLADLNEHVKQVVVLANKSTEAKLEKSITFVLAGVDLLDEFKIKPAEAPTATATPVTPGQ